MGCTQLSTSGADETTCSDSRPSLAETANPDQVVVLFCPFPGRSVTATNQSALYRRVKDQFTAVLTIYAGRDEDPLANIGRSRRRSKSFLENFKPERDLVLFCFQKERAWHSLVFVYRANERNEHTQLPANKDEIS